MTIMPNNAVKNTRTHQRPGWQLPVARTIQIIRTTQQSTLQVFDLLVKSIRCHFVRSNGKRCTRSYLGDFQHAGKKALSMADSRLFISERRMCARGTTTKWKQRRNTWLLACDAPNPNAYADRINVCMPCRATWHTWREPDTRARQRRGQTADIPEASRWVFAQAGDQRSDHKRSSSLMARRWEVSSAKWVSTVLGLAGGGIHLYSSRDGWLLFNARNLCARVSDEDNALYVYTVITF